MKKTTSKTLTRLSGGSSNFRRLSALSVFILLPFFMLAQLGGIWYGELHNDSSHKKQSFELGLSEYRGKITGFTYTTFIENDTFYYSVKRIKAEKKDGMLIITDDEMVSNNFPERRAKGVKQTTIFPLINDSTIDITKGSWSTNQTKKYYSLKGTAQVQLQEDRDQSDLVAHLDEMKVKNNLVVQKPKKKTEEAFVQKTAPVNKPVEKKTENAKQPSPPTTKQDQAIKKEEEKQNQTTVINPETRPGVPAENIHTSADKNNDVQKSNSQTASLAITPAIEKNRPSQTTNAPIQTKSITNTNIVAKQTTAEVPVSKKAELPLVQNEQVEVKKAVTSPKKDSIVMKALPAIVATRKNETIQSLYFHSDSLVLSLYDNGVVDGDTVSVFLNGNPIISKQQLKVSAFKKTIYITQDMDSVELVLFADNLGSIPPNTGLLTVLDGDQTFNVRFSADLQKNAAIRLHRKK